MTAPLRRKRAQRGHGDQLREQILAAAAQLIAETGRDPSIRAVAERIGVTPPSIYLHFADKDALLDELCLEVFADLHEAMDAAAGSREDVEASLRDQGRAYIEFALARPEHYRLLFMRQRDLDMPTEAELSAVAGLSSVIDTVRVGQERGLINDDPTRVAFTLWACVHGIASLLIAKPHFPWGDRDDLIERVARAALHGAL
jgi:AcrR family transcriptional regulator